MPRRFAFSKPRPRPRPVDRIELPQRTDVRAHVSWSPRRRCLVFHVGDAGGRWSSCEVHLGRLLVDLGIDATAVTEAVEHHSIVSGVDARWFSGTVRGRLEAERRIMATITRIATENVAEAARAEARRGPGDDEEGDDA